MCGVLWEEAWYPLGIWLGVKDSDFEYLKQDHWLTDHLKIEELLEETILYNMKEVQKFKEFLSECLPDVWFSSGQSFIKKDNDYLPNVFSSLDQPFIKKANDYVAKLKDSLLKNLAEKFLQDVLCRKEKMIVNALVKIGLKDKVEEMKGI